MESFHIKKILTVLTSIIPKIATLEVIIVVERMLCQLILIKWKLVMTIKCQRSTSPWVWENPSVPIKPESLSKWLLKVKKQIMILQKWDFANPQEVKASTILWIYWNLNFNPKNQIFLKSPKYKMNKIPKLPSLWRKVSKNYLQNILQSKSKNI